MHDPIPLGMALILGLGMAAQWISWRLNLPSILLLLLTGIAVGPVLGWVNPEHIFGDLMHPIISLAVAVILFEGGLSLRLSDLREVGRTVRNLITIGVVVTWALASVSAWGILGMPLRVAVLLVASAAVRIHPAARSRAHTTPLPRRANEKRGRFHPRFPASVPV